ncbi:hypothetical protein P885DRAFT_76361 [Corynascus similis CBS 632.67]
MTPWNRLQLLILLLSSLFSTTSLAHEAKATAPQIYSGNFGDCLAGKSVLEVTRFDVAYDAGNGTLALHLDGTSSVKNEFVSLQLSIDGYGTNLFAMTVDPCSVNITSLCPLTLKTPFSASTVLPVGNQRLGELSSFPFNLPDYEGSAKLQVFAKANREAIGCVQAAVTNGKTLSHPEIIAPVLGVFTLMAIVVSFLTAAYGVSVPHMRMHHAHSLSVLVVFETLQTVFFSGALSVDWPPILVAWWSNFAWSAGLIHAPAMVQSINAFAGVDDNAAQPFRNSESSSWIFGRASVGDASSGAAGEGRAYNSSFLHHYAWSGNAVAPGLPVPGNWSGFPGTLSILNIPVADAFMVGLVWLLIAIGLIALAIAVFKAVLEGLVAGRKIKPDRLGYFRTHWTGYLGNAMLRTIAAAFFMLMTLAMLQLTIRMTVGPVAVATVVFILVLIGVVALVASGCKTRTRDGRFSVSPDRLICFRKDVSGIFPGIGFVRKSTVETHALDIRAVFGVPFFKIRHSNNDSDRPNVHLDEPFIKRFGWLTARYRRTRWWFLAYHIGYLFCRAAFLGGSWQTPRIQMYGVLVADIVNFVVAVILSPFEGARNTAMGVWILGICKIVTTGVSTAYLPGSDIGRSKATVLGIVIIAIQVLMVAALFVLVILSTISSYLSMMRNREEMDPDWLEPMRVRYFTKMERTARDVRFDNEAGPPPPTPRFSVLSIQRRPKIEDEDEDMNPALYGPEHHHQQMSDDNSVDDPQLRACHDNYGRAGSVSPRLSTGSLPRAARPYRVSWSSREVGELSAASPSRPDSIVTKRLSGVTCVVVTDHSDSLSPSTDAASWADLEAAAVASAGSLQGGTHTPLSVSRSSSPSVGGRRSSREIARVGCSGQGDGRRPPTALPEAPEPQE